MREGCVRRLMVSCVVLMILVISDQYVIAGIIGISPWPWDNEVEITYYTGFGGPAISDVIATPFVPLDADPPLQLDTTIWDGQNVSTAKAGLGHYFEPCLLAVRVADATGVSQFAPSPLEGYEPASLHIELDEIEFETDAQGFGPWAWCRYFFRLSGTVGTGGFVQFVLDLEVEDADFYVNWTRTTPGPFDVVLTGSALAEGEGPFGEWEIEGLLRFVAKSGDEASCITCGEWELAPFAVPEPRSVTLLAELLAIAVYGRFTPARRTRPG
jgi:hypothetical protein